ncbi:DEAD/DEAH box helicase [Gordonia sp. NPDC003429]
MPDLQPLVIGEDALIDEFGAAALARGTLYARQHRVMVVRWSDDELTLTGRCRGSNGQIYTTTIVFTRIGGERALLRTRCTCPVGGGCKHGVALLLTAGTVDRDTEPVPAPVRDQGASLSTVAQPNPPTRFPPQWRTVLGELGESSANDPGTEPLGILVELPEPTGYLPRPAPTLRLVAPGKRGTWVRTGVHWRMFIGSPLVFSSAITAAFDRFDPAVVAPIRAIVRAVRAESLHGFDDVVTLTDAPTDIWELLAAARDAGVTFVAHQSTGATRVELIDGARAGITISRDGSDAVVTPRIEVDHAAWDGQPVGLIGRASPHGMFSRVDDLLLLGPFTAPPSRTAFEQLVSSPSLRIPAEDIPEFATGVLPGLSSYLSVDVHDGAITMPEVVGPIPVLTLRMTDDGGAHTSWCIGYRVDERLRTFDRGSRTGGASYRDADVEARMWSAARPAFEKVANACARWHQQAQRYVRQSQRHNVTHHNRGSLVAVADLAADPDAAISRADLDLLLQTYTLSPSDLAMIWTTILPELTDGGLIDVVIIGDDPTYRLAEGAPTIEIGADDSPDNDWLNLRITVEIDGHAIPLPDVLRELSAGTRYMLLADGVCFSLDNPELIRLAELVEEAESLGEVDRGRIRRGTVHATLWDELLALGVIDEQLAQWRSRIATLADAEPPTTGPAPVLLHAELRDYQSVGLDWLRFLWRNRIGGILADDMGLGKTVQTLALAADVVADDPDARILVVAPTSVVGNWIREAQRFVPDIPAVAVSAMGTRSGICLDERIGDARIVVTSYTLLRLQFERFDEFRWAVAVFDEAQFVKNHHSKAHQCARRLGAEIKVAITGTPMENNLMELWSLLSLTVPGLFPSPKTFTEYFRRPIENGSNPGRLELLRRRIRPVMLRRTKDQVVTDLPPKQEQVVTVELSPRHDKIYQTHLTRERERVLGLIGDWDENRFAIFRSLTVLRQLSLHAGLVDAEHASVASAKIDYLADNLPELVAEGHSALVFSQFTGFLSLVRERLDQLGIEYRYLDGSMSAKQRAAAIESFSGGSAQVFLISLKAGGFGLNLTEADYCFVCDPWWNPAAEAQAVDRAHRIGQTRPVTVYRLVSAGTIEEKVVALQARKRELFDAVIDDGELFGTAISADDVRDMLSGSKSDGHEATD